ncbi:MAG: DegQ family serine endoprotease [Steroidobacteraceae bacterium]|jgi:serine protease Do/serine protease DegQ|nr:DegQ family serine endoprotease [Steroidobacteraceae bacterium]
MTRPALLAATLACLAAVAPLPADAQGATTVAEPRVPSLAPMIKRVSPAVVNIGIRGTIKERGGQRNPLLDDPFFRRFFDVPPDQQGPRERPFQSAGSGVIVDAKAGYIVTNAHVVENASEITVTLQDGRDLAAEVVGSDERTDIAVVKVKGDSLTQIALGNSDRVEVGDYVVAIGNPFGLQHTVTQGIVSGLGRSGINPDGYENLIQTDAAINPGNSGGALVNLQGELIAINSAILSRSGGNIGIGFAVPVNMARSVMDQLIKFGSVRRGLLGVNIAPVTPDIAQALGLPSAGGALVTQVVKDSAADKAGIRAGDVITSVNGQSVKSNTELRNAIGLMRVGDKLEVGLLRDGQARKFTAMIAEPADAATAGTAGGAAGGATPAEGAPVHRALAGASFADGPEGVVVRAVEPGSAAAAAGLRAGDVIAVANRTAVKTVAQLRAAAPAGGSGPFVLQLRRGPTTIVLPLR